MRTGQARKAGLDLVDEYSEYFNSTRRNNSSPPIPPVPSFIHDSSERCAREFMADHYGRAPETDYIRIEFSKTATVISICRLPPQVEKGCSAMELFGKNG